MKPIPEIISDVRSWYANDVFYDRIDLPADLALANEVERLQADAARLDWMESHCYSSYCYGDDCHCVVVRDRDRFGGGFTGTIREAIDQARKETT